MGPFLRALLGKKVRHPPTSGRGYRLVGTTLATVLEGPSAQPGWYPSDYLVTAQSLLDQCSIPGVGIDGIMNILEPVVVFVACAMGVLYGVDRAF